MLDQIKFYRTLVMGVLNVTPDSFSDGGVYNSLEAAIERAEIMEAEGADIIDIGGESSRPGSDSVSDEVEAARVLPVIENLAGRVKIPISIDTYKSFVAERAIKAGASIVNDINALENSDMASLIAESGAYVILMHKKGNPKDMQINPSYESLMFEIISFLADRIKIARKAGIAEDKIIIDPGIGFGKTIDHNLEILRRLGELKSLGKPILVGTSRKLFIGKTLDLPIEQRLEGTSATVAIAIANGANIIRVHDVKEMVRVARMTDAIIGKT